MSDDDYRELQIALVLNPVLGALIPNSGGLRKTRWHLQGKGKRGGVRVIYYWYVQEDQIYMLLVYGKNEQDTLTNRQLKLLKQAVERGLNDAR